MKIAIIITTFNASILLENTINAIKETINYENYVIVVVDNGGSDDTSDILMKYYPEVKIIKLEKNVGFPIAANRGIRGVYADFYFILANDILIVTKNWINILLSEYDKDKSLGIIAGRLVNVFNETITKNTFRKYIQLYSNKKIDSSNRDYVKTLGGAGILIHRKTFESVGLLDEKFSPGYYEDTDLCERIQKRGFKILILNDIKLLHFVSSTFKKFYSKEFVHFYLIPRNRIRFKILHPTLMRIITEPLSILRALAHIVLKGTFKQKRKKLIYLLAALRFNLDKKNFVQKI